MTGLEVEKDKIIEIACIVTSGNLDIVAEVCFIIIFSIKKILVTTTSKEKPWIIRRRRENEIKQTNKQH